MKIEDAKDRLREIYIGYGFEERPMAKGELCFFDKRRDYPVLAISADEIKEFAEVADDLAAIEIGPVETCVLGPSLREQWLEPLDAYRGPIFGFAERERTIRFGDGQAGNPFIEIGAPSALFRNFYRDKGQQFPFFQERLMRRIGIARSGSTDMFRGMLTVRVCNLTENWDAASLERSQEMIESCLFDLTYLKNMALSLRSSWPMTMAERRRERQLRFDRLVSGDEFPLKNVVYDGAVTKFYQRAVSSDDAYTSFISFYHILEYYFVSVSDNRLYNRLERIVNDPAFSARQKQLDRIIASVDEHGRESDETEMLKGVLLEFVDEGDLLRFIEKYEDRPASKIYTEKTTCFGYEIDKMNLKAGHIFGPIAKRIKTIRNALVHSSDRYERKERYVPGEEASRVLMRELPLLRFLAEKVIIATARIG
ncbi:conserved protein of unknown function [uncultured Sphingopyxis sp.]|uniref:Apea-like HEPN domain-containing protein n=1 Tax=uncultured Sphingopyxis sp. TaxID=310581 RepID=A0A1Y5PT75_9SPHN|nr:hypothetical protein [uncultured Sphingopyxis sp.]SBV33198.1 conserved protein of unknown function [uncultured Sphingopyxis sp.]